MLIASQILSSVLLLFLISLVFGDLLPLMLLCFIKIITLNVLDHCLVATQLKLSMCVRVHACVHACAHKHACLHYPHPLLNCGHYCYIFVK